MVFVFCIFVFLSFCLLYVLSCCAFSCCLFAFLSFWFFCHSVFLYFCSDIILIKFWRVSSLKRHSLCQNSKVALSDWLTKVRYRAARAAKNSFRVFTLCAILNIRWGWGLILTLIKAINFHKLSRCCLDMIWFKSSKISICLSNIIW